MISEQHLNETRDEKYALVNYQLFHGTLRLTKGMWLQNLKPWHGIYF